ncbi:SGNH/GDSL hydrolase family protein [Amylibacter sp. SFDW26]|nr:SGNH/GDSL hydrolase family protein [Amylibacter sp. SFDW26]
MGDSLLAWHKLTGRSITQVAGKELDISITDRSLSGARMIYKLPITGTVGFSIPRQYTSGEWDWVILTGGGNDLWLGCGCTRCNRKLNKLISEDTQTGAIPKLVSKLRKKDTKVIYVGYLRTPGQGSPIDHCRDEGDILESRISALAKHDDGVHFLSLKKLVPNGDLSYHAADRIHPSVKASKEIGKLVADIIAD